MIINQTLEKYKYPKEAVINLFEDSAFFDSYEALYAEIERINKKSSSYLKEFS